MKLKDLLNESIQLANDIKMDKLLKGKEITSFIFDDQGLKALASTNVIDNTNDKGVGNRKLTVYVSTNKDDLVKLMHIKTNDIEKKVLDEIIKEFGLKLVD
jgi:hypothetical protein